MLGVVPTEEALQRARDAELDLVEVASESDPPVCRILDYGKYRYEQSKKDKANKAKSKTAEMKEVRLGRSMKIDPHDVLMRLNQARQFLMKGHKVQIVQNFRGREMIHRHRGYDRMREITDALGDIAKVEMTPRQAGRRMTMILAPDKPKIEAIKRQEEAERKRAAAAKEGTAEGAPEAAAETPVAETPASPAEDHSLVDATDAVSEPAAESATEPEAEPIEAREA